MCSSCPRPPEVSCRSFPLRLRRQSLQRTQEVHTHWERSDSNREPRDYESPALTVELRSLDHGIVASRVRMARFTRKHLLPTMPDMKPAAPDFIGRLVAAPQLRELARKLSQTRAAAASGLWGSSVAAVVAAVRAELSRPVLL